MKRTLALTIVSLCISISYASWQNPVMLSELNDYQNSLTPGYSMISCDESTILFNRNTPLKTDAVWEAKRDENGLFTIQRQLSELRSGGVQVYGAWLSADKLRLYYCPSELSRRSIWMAVRNDLNSPWQTLKKHGELEVNAFVNDCTFTADENTVMYEAATWSGGGVRPIFSATRLSLLHSFSNIKEHFELEALQAMRPRMTPDGLRVYFRIWNVEKWDMWVGRRYSLDKPFGDFRPVTELNLNCMSTDPSLSWDGKRIYYTFTYRGFDINTRGIYVSQWVDDSFEDAIANMHRAINKKQQAIELLRQASQEEQVAYNLFTTLPPNAFPAALTARDTNNAVKKLAQSMAKQDQIASILDLCVNNLKLSIGILVPPLLVQ